MNAQDKLAAALRRQADDDQPRPPPQPSESTATQGKLSLKKSNLLGLVTWEEALRKLDLLGKHEFAQCSETIVKMFTNVLSNPLEPKFRKIRCGNPTFNAKVYSCTGAPDLFRLVGFKESVEEGSSFLVLPEGADIALLRKVIDELAAQEVVRSEAEEKKRKLDQEKAAQAREARAQKAREEAAPGAYDTVVAGASSQMLDEDEAMLSAIEAFMEAQSHLKAGRALDSYEIERQVAGPGGSVVASVVASAGTSYYDYVATMKRSADGAWSVQKIAPA